MRVTSTVRLHHRPIATPLGVHPGQSIAPAAADEETLTEGGGPSAAGPPSSTPGRAREHATSSTAATALGLGRISTGYTLCAPGATKRTSLQASCRHRFGELGTLLCSDMGRRRLGPKTYPKLSFTFPELGAAERLEWG